MSRLIRAARRSFYIVKIDEKTWDKIGSYIENNYENISITIERGEEFDVLDGMHLAYEYICENPDTITRIIIFAHSGADSMEITFNTSRKQALCAMSVYAYAPDSEKANDIRIFSESLVLQTRTSTRLIRFSAVFYFYAVLLHVIGKVEGASLSEEAIIGLFFLFAAGMIALDFFVYNPLLEDLIYGKRRVQFWTDDERIQRYKRKKRWGWHAGWLLMVISAGAMFLMISI